MRHDAPDPTAATRAAAPPVAAPPSAGTADAPTRPPPSPPAAAARTPEEYTEAPGSHRRPDGAATDVGA